MTKISCTIKIRKKWFAAIVACTLVFIALALQPQAKGAESPDTSKVLIFASDVAKLDLSKYSIELKVGPFVEPRSDLGGLVEVHGVYRLKSPSSEVDVGFNIINGTLTWFFLDVINGMPIFSQPLISLSDSALSFLDRYSAFCSDSSLASMGDMISSVDIHANNSLQSGNLRLDVFNLDVFATTITDLTWRYYVNGAPYGGVGVGFKNGAFSSFSDDRTYVRVGSTVVNVSKEQAVDLALVESHKFWYTYQGKNYSSFGVVERNIEAHLQTAPRDLPLDMFPYWLVNLPLDKWYPGYISLIVVEIWANTGEIRDIYPLGAGGGPDVSVEPSPSASPEPVETPAVTDGFVSPSPVLSPSNSPPTSASASPAVSLLPSSTDSGISDESLRFDWAPVAAVAAVAVAVGALVIL